MKKTKLYTCSSCDLDSPRLWHCEACDNELCEFCIENINDHLCCEGCQGEFWNQEDADLYKTEVM